MDAIRESTGLAFLVALAWKSTLVLGLAGGLALLAKRRSAALRHAIWTAGVFALLALPLLGVSVPRIAAPLPAVLAPVSSVPGGDRATIRPPGIVESRERERAGEAKRADRVDANGVAPRVEPDARRLELPAIGRFAIVAWLAGMIGVLLFFAAGRLALTRQARRARPLVEPAWLAAAAGVERRLGLRRTPRYLVADDAPAPLTWGVFRPTVLLPARAAAWSSAQREAFLVHELAHVARRDCAVQEAAHLACAIYWFHPGAWLAAQRLRVEREPACDDLVLAHGADPAAYARQLIEVVRAGRVPRGALALSGAAMAAPSRLEARVRALLDGGQDRRRVGRRGFLFGAALAGIVLVPLAAIVPAAPRPASAQTTSTAATPAAGASALAERWERALREPPGRSFWFAYAVPFDGGRDGKEVLLSDSEGWNADDLTRKGTTLAARLGAGETDAVVLLRVTRAQGGSKPVFDRVTLRTARFSPDLGRLPVVAAGVAGLDESLDWLTARLSETPDDERAGVLVSALAIHRLPRTASLLEGLLEGSRGDAVRSEAAQGLSRHPGARSLELLVTHARTDRSLEVRRESAEAIGDLDYGPATPALIALARELDDEPVQIEAVEALGQREGEQVVSVLVDLAKDKRVPVSARREAAEALGELDDAPATPALIALVRELDDEPVKMEAVEALGEREPERVVSVLVEVADDKRASESVRREAVETLGDLPDNKGLEALRRMAMHSDDRAVREEAVETLNDLAERAREMAKRN